MTIAHRLIKVVVAAALLVPTAALAVITWQFGSTGSVTADGITVTPSARGFTSGTNNNYLANAQLFFYSGNGFGVRNADCCTADSGEDVPNEHTMDNQGRVDLLLFSFSEAVNLETVVVGWRAVDSDISVLAFKPNDATATTLPSTSSGIINGLNHSQLVSAGFQLIGTYDGPNATSSGSGTDIEIDTGTSATSKFWLVSAADSRWTGSLPTGIDGGDDYVKILKLYGYTPSNGVPEPHALLLLGIAMVGLWATRGSRQRAA
jgi:hypothetical protein